MRTLALLLSSLFFAQIVSANISEPPRPRPGQLSFEPILGKHFSVTSEKLVVDLRQAEKCGNGLVHATYRFVCDTALDSVQLVFVANNLDGKQFRILLDNQPVSGDTATLDSVPKSWYAGHSLQWDNSTVSLQPEDDWRGGFHNAYILFTIPVSTGMHTLSVSYEAVVPKFYLSTTTTYAFVYILSPAKDWKEYKELDLEVLIPENWDWRSDLTLRKEKEALHGHWNQLPADTFYIATRYPDRNADLYQNIYLFGGWGFLLLIIGWRLLAVTKKFIAGERKSGYTWSLPVWAMLIGAIGFYVIYFNRELPMKAIYGDQLKGGYTHGDFYAIFGFPFVWVFGVGIGYAIQAIGYSILNAKNK